MDVTWIKFCGCTSWDDVAAAVDAGADAVGLIFAPSPRRISWDAARAIAPRLEGNVEVVGVFVDPSAEEVEAARTLFAQMTVQLSGHEPSEFVRRYGDRAIKAIAVDDATDTQCIAETCRTFEPARILFDARHETLAGGTGKTFAWDRVAPIGRERPIVIAGGLTPENVARCVAGVRPFGVDVRSGIETGGRKDPVKMRAFVRAVREADRR